MSSSTTSLFNPVFKLSENPELMTTLILNDKAALSYSTRHNNVTLMNLTDGFSTEMHSYVCTIVYREEPSQAEKLADPSRRDVWKYDTTKCNLCMGCGKAIKDTADVVYRELLSVNRTFGAVAHKECLMAAYEAIGFFMLLIGAEEDYEQTAMK